MMEKKTSDEIISCLWFYLSGYFYQEYSFITWSDNCVSQNTAWRILFFHAWLVFTKRVNYYFYLFFNLNF
jgi:hypothetical protein